MASNADLDESRETNDIIIHPNKENKRRANTSVVKGRAKVFASDITYPIEFKKPDIYSRPVLVRAGGRTGSTIYGSLVIRLGFVRDRLYVSAATNQRFRLVPCVFDSVDPFRISDYALDRDQSEILLVFLPFEQASRRKDKVAWKKEQVQGVVTVTEIVVSFQKKRSFENCGD
jgi:hypothetical protein